MLRVATVVLVNNYPNDQRQRNPMDTKISKLIYRKVIAKAISNELLQGYYPSIDVNSDQKSDQNLGKSESVGY
jgi:hypothetical protein